MAVKAIRDILMASPPVVSLVGARVSPVLFAQNTALPCVVLTRVSCTPANHLHGRPTMDENHVQLDVFAETYDMARQVADACRDALEAQDVTMESETDSFEADVTEYRVTQEFLIWT